MTAINVVGRWVSGYGKIIMMTPEYSFQCRLQTEAFKYGQSKRYRELERPGLQNRLDLYHMGCCCEVRPAINSDQQRTHYVPLTGW